MSFYSKLGIDKNANLNEIKEAFRKKVDSFLPLIDPEEFREVFFSYVILTEYEKYNESLLKIDGQKNSNVSELKNAFDLIVNDKLRKAIKILRHLVKEDSESKMAYLLLAYAYCKNFDSRRALFTMQKVLEKFPLSPEFLYICGICCSKTYIYSPLAYECFKLLFEKTDFDFSVVELVLAYIFTNALTEQSVEESLNQVSKRFLDGKYTVYYDFLAMRAYSFISEDYAEFEKNVKHYYDEIIRKASESEEYSKFTIELSKYVIERFSKVSIDKLNPQNIFFYLISLKVYAELQPEDFEKTEKYRSEEKFFESTLLPISTYIKPIRIERIIRRYRLSIGFARVSLFLSAFLTFTIVFAFIALPILYENIKNIKLKKNEINFIRFFVTFLNTLKGTDTLDFKP